MSEANIIRPRSGYAAYGLAHLAAGESRPLSGVLSITGFDAQIIEENETEAVVPELKHVGLIQVLDRRPTMFVKLDGPARETDLRHDSFIVIPPGLDSRWQSHRCRGRVLHIQIGTEAFVKWTHAECLPQDLWPVLNVQNRVLANLAQALRHELEHAPHTTAIYLEALAVAVSCNLLRVAGRKEVALPATGGLAAYHLKRTTDYMLSHLAEDVSLAELAAIADLSPHHFCRAFKQSTGLPPHAWLAARRIERAQEMMLAHKELGLTEIALCVGYQSQAAFGVAFKRATGVTPGQWRRERMG